MGPFVIFLRCFSLFILVAAASAQEISVKLIDVRNGRAMANEPVAVRFLASNPEEQNRKDLQPLRLTTGTDGIARFSLPNMHALGISVDAPSLSLFRCGASVHVKSEVLLQAGAAAQNSCGQSVGVRPKPGEIVLFARPMHWWERLLAPLTRE